MSGLTIDADPQELAASAAVLHRVAGRLTDRAHELLSLSAQLRVGWVPGWVPGPASGAGGVFGAPPFHVAGPEAAAHLAALAGAGGLLGRAGAIEALARKLQVTALGYRVADVAGAAALAVALRALAGPLVPLRGPATTGDVLAGLERWVSLSGPWLRESLAVSVVARPAAWAGPVAGAAGVLARVPKEGLHVERLSSPSGGRAWLVGVPGTSDWSPSAARTPFDLTGDVRLMAGEASAGQAAVLAALRSLGVRRGEPILLAGHSQGGLIAASLAARADVRREFTITQVVTSGAPIAFVDLPRSVNTLSIEHTDDPVPKADGRANPVRAGWITVRGPSPAAVGPRELLTQPLRAHRAGLYRRTAAAVDGTADPALTEWRLGARPFLSATEGQAYDFTVGRQGSDGAR